MWNDSCALLSELIGIKCGCALFILSLLLLHYFGENWQVVKSNPRSAVSRCLTGNKTRSGEMCYITFICSLAVWKESSEFKSSRARIFCDLAETTSTRRVFLMSPLCAVHHSTLSLDWRLLCRKQAKRLVSELSCVRRREGSRYISVLWSISVMTSMPSFPSYTTENAQGHSQQDFIQPRRKWRLLNQSVFHQSAWILNIISLLSALIHSLLDKCYLFFKNLGSALIIYI